MLTARQGILDEQGFAIIRQMILNSMSLLATPTRLLLAACLSLGCPAATFAVDFVTTLKNGTKTELEGRIELEAQDGGVLLLTRDGVLWPLPKEEIAFKCIIKEFWIEICS